MPVSESSGRFGQIVAASISQIPESGEGASRICGFCFFFVAHRQDSLQQKDVRQKSAEEKPHGGEPAENGAKSPGVPSLQCHCQTFNFFTSALQQL